MKPKPIECCRNGHTKKKCGACNNQAARDCFLCSKCNRQWHFVCTFGDEVQEEDTDLHCPYCSQCTKRFQPGRNERKCETCFSPFGLTRANAYTLCLECNGALSFVLAKMGTRGTGALPLSCLELMVRVRRISHIFKDSEEYRSLKGKITQRLTMVRNRDWKYGTLVRFNISVSDREVAAFIKYFIAFF